MSDARWPQATLSETTRLRVLAAGLRGAVVRERVIDARFDEVWGFIADLERSVPTFDVSVRALRVTRRDGERLRAVVTTGWGPVEQPVGFDVELHQGWCWMVSRPRLYVVGMAAEPAGERTRFVHMEAIARAAPLGLRPLLWPLHAVSRWWNRRHVPADLDGIERALRS